MLADMMGRAVSPVFVGRKTELADLAEAFEQARKNAAATVLLGGEAGVGKSRLIGCFAERAADDGAHVLIGGCVELSTEGLAYAPFTAAIRQLVRESSAEEVAALLPEGGARDLARLLPEFGEPSGDMESDTARARLFEQILTLLERLAERRPVILIIEDIHWADRSSRDLIAFLSRNLRTAPVLMILTYRSDDLHRQHPLRPVLAELGRLDGVLRLDLPRLTQAEVAAQMAGILGSTPEFAQVDKVFQRSEGIPLFVEALMECGGDCTFPDSLHDLIIGSVEQLSDETQRVLRIAAAGGLRTSHDLLAAVSGLSDVDLEAALRTAIAANVLQVADGNAYVFRHSLIREAVHDELLPGEHGRLHARYAEEISRDRTLVPSGRAAIEIAHHWYSARDDLWALISAWEAAGKAAKTFAYNEKMQLLERVLALWSKVPDASERIGVDHTRVLEQASEAANSCGEIDRGMKFVKAALAELDEKAEPERVAELFVRLSLFKMSKRRSGVLDDLRYAERLVPEPGLDRAHVLSKLGSYLIFSGEAAEGTALTEEALRIAREHGDDCLEADLLLNLALSHSIAGRLDIAITVNTTAQAIGERVGSGRIILRALANNVDALNNMGRSAEAIELALEGERLAKAYGRYRVSGTFIANNRAETLEALGRFEEAAEVVEQALSHGSDPAPPASPTAGPRGRGGRTGRDRPAQVHPDRGGRPQRPGDVHPGADRQRPAQNGPAPAQRRAAGRAGGGRAGRARVPDHEQAHAGVADARPAGGGLRDGRGARARAVAALRAQIDEAWATMTVGQPGRRGLPSRPHPRPRRRGNRLGTARTAPTSAPSRCSTRGERRRARVIATVPRYGCERPIRSPSRCRPSRWSPRSSPWLAGSGSPSRRRPPAAENAC